MSEPKIYQPGYIYDEIPFGAPPSLNARIEGIGIPFESERGRHGSPTFYKLLDEMAETHSRKSHDYASNDNPYGNYHFAGQVAILFNHSSQDAGFAGRIAEKIYRLAILEGGNKTPLNESVEDTERDIATIVALWMADRRDRRLKDVSLDSQKP